MAKLAVVVVLDEIAVRPSIGPLEQTAAPSGRHGYPKGKLVGGGNIGQTCARAV